MSNGAIRYSLIVTSTLSILQCPGKIQTIHFYRHRDMNPVAYISFLLRHKPRPSSVFPLSRVAYPGRLLLLDIEASNHVSHNACDESSTAKVYTQRSPIESHKLRPRCYYCYPTSSLFLLKNDRVIECHRSHLRG